jgi:voltage-gated potassium channel
MASSVEFSSRDGWGGFRRGLNILLFDIHTKAGRWTNMIITLLIVISVMISMTGTIKGLEPEWQQKVRWLEYAFTYLFLFELLLRCYAARNMRAYLFSFYGLVDVLTVLPMLLLGDANLAIRMLRIIRLLKLVRYLRALRLFIATMKDTFEILFVVFGSIALGAILAGNIIYALEPETFSSAFEGAWWSIVTMTTVGYGDVVPHTLAGKMVATCLMVMGICMFAVVTGVVSLKIARAIQHGERCKACARAIASEFTYCPYCAADQSIDADEDVAAETEADSN